MNIFIRLTDRNSKEEIQFQLAGEDNEHLWLISSSDEKDRLPLKYVNGEMLRIDGDLSRFDEPKEVIDERLSGLTENFVEAQGLGMEVTSEESGDAYDGRRGKPGYNPDDIYVENKPFSIRQLMDLIDQKDLDLAPNFQRNFIWDRTRQSLLIESILLGLPLPSIYLSQYPDGLLTVVDGLQRIHTIKNFMDNKLRLCNLEYLDNFNGKTFEELKDGLLSPLRLRRFGQTQLMCFVIDYRSPSKLKFDLFRRLNTGGKPLNGQEIRNCLSKPVVQEALNAMSSSEEFKMATDNSVTNTRLQAQEAALRFLYFRQQYSYAPPVGCYDGKMDDTLDDYVDYLNNNKKDFTEEVRCYREAMKSSYHLFGKSAFRKPNYGGRRLGVNKLLMLGISVLLSFYSYEEIEERFRGRDLVGELASLIGSNEEFYRAITYGTNSKWNIATAIEILQKDLFAF